MNYPVRAQLASLAVVILLVGAAFGGYYLNTSSVLASRDQTISSLQAQVNSLQHVSVSTSRVTIITSTVTTTVNTILTSYTTLTKNVTTTTTFSPSSYVQILSVRTNLTRIGSTSNYSLLFVVTWKNISNSTIYYVDACGEGQLASSILPTSTAKVAVVRGGGCQPAWSTVAMKSGVNITSTDPKGGWDEKSYVVMSAGRVDASLTLLWSIPGPPSLVLGNTTFYYSFQV